MVRSEAQKKAQIKYRENAEKYDIVKSINRKSNKKNMPKTKNSVIR